MNHERQDHFSATAVPLSRTRRGLFAAALLSVTVMFAYFLWSSYREAVIDAKLNTQNLVLALTSRLQGTLARTDAVLGELAHDATPAMMQKSALAARRQDVSARMARQLANFPDVSGTYYFDVDGDMLYSSDPKARGSNVADRPFFRHLRERNNNALEFSDALVARTTGRWSVVIARGIRDKDGRFLGVTTALLDLENYAQLLSAMNVGAQSTIVLRRSDNFTLVTRYPSLPGQGVATLPADNPLRVRIVAGERTGTLNYRAQQDSVVRLSSFSVLEHYPFYLYVGFAPDEYLDGWHQQLIGAIVLATALLLLFGFFAVRMLRSDALVVEVQRQILESEARLRAIIENEPECIKIVDAQGRLTQMNPAGLAMIEADSEAQVVGQPVSAVIAPEYRAAFAGMHQRVLAGATEQMEFEVQGLKGGRRWLETHAVPMQENGVTVQLAVTRDISARKQAEAELLRSNSELEQFSYSISHDMRQPLRMISSYLQLLKKGLGDTLDAEKREYFNFAIDGAQRLDAMLRGLLEYSRIGRNGEPPVWIESRAVLAEALLFLRPLVADALADVRIEGVWPRVLASPDELLRLLQNLISNALKFRVEGRPPVVTLTGEMIAGNWRLCVADNGLGMPPDQIDRLFQVFQRLQSRIAYEGTGIGLALCRKIAEHHGGRIRAESAGEDLGSRFIVELPVPREPLA